MNISREGIELKWLLNEKNISKLTDEEMKLIVNKKLAHLIIEFENNSMLYLMGDLFDCRY